MELLYKIELKWHLGYPGSDNNYTEIVPLFSRDDETIRTTALWNVLKNAKLVDENHNAELSNGINSDFYATIVDSQELERDVYVDIHLTPLLKSGESYFELKETCI